MEPLPYTFLKKGKGRKKLNWKETRFIKTFFNNPVSGKEPVGNNWNFALTAELSWVTILALIGTEFGPKLGRGLMNAFRFGPKRPINARLSFVKIFNPTFGKKPRLTGKLVG